MLPLAQKSPTNGPGNRSVDPVVEDREVSGLLAGPSRRGFLQNFIDGHLNGSVGYFSEQKGKKARVEPSVNRPYRQGPWT